jgi:hypothetical protein
VFLGSRRRHEILLVPDAVIGVLIVGFIRVIRFVRSRRRIVIIIIIIILIIIIIIIIAFLIFGF